MMRKIKSFPFHVVLIFFNILYLSGYGQHGGVYSSHRHPTETKWQEGFIVTSNGDTLHGEVRKFIGKVWYQPYPKSSSERPEVATIENKSILKLRLFATDTSVVIPWVGYTEFVRMPKGDVLYRQITEGRVSVFDLSNFSNEKSGYIMYTGMLIVRGNLTERIGRGNKKKKLINTINKFFNKTFTQVDFENKREALRWIQNHAND